MNEYIATFHTHLSALLTFETLRSRGVEARMMPVPRALSSSCGTCVRYTAPYACQDLLDRDWEAVYGCRGEDYTCLYTAEEP